MESMNALKDKSDLNLEASRLLCSSSLYDNVCHPAYYACLQLISYKLAKKGIDLNQQATIASSQYNGNSHKALINSISSYIKTDDYHDKKLYDKYIKELKEMRERADYKNARIKKEESEKCIRMSEFVVHILNSI